jgi:hypothetical protein
MNPLISIGIILFVALFALAGFASSHNLRDATRKLSLALGNGAATVYSTPGLDTGKSTALATQPGDVEYLLTAPAMNATEMPDAKTMIYSILHDDVNPIDSSSVVLMPSVITQTGAGGAGCAAATYRFRLPSDAKPIIGFKAVGSAAGNATTATATLEELA